MNETAKSKTVRDYCELHPRMANRTLARLVLKEHPELANSSDSAKAIENMRDSVRRTRGLHGHVSRSYHNRVPKLATDSGKWTPKILIFDIETTPMKSYHWGSYKQFISPVQVLEYTKVLCWSAKWLDSDAVLFERQMPRDKGDDKRICVKLWELCDEADILIAHNGQAFDIGVMRARWLDHGLVPPSPSKMVDTLKIVRKQFRFPDNKLETLVKYLGLGTKLAHTGFQLWIDCMAHKAEAWRLMEEYNVRDVTILESLYKQIRPWDTRHPNVALLYDDAKTRCVCCGHTSFTAVKHKQAMTSVSLFDIKKCKSCGKNMRVGKREKLQKDILRNVI